MTGEDNDEKDDTDVRDNAEYEKQNLVPRQELTFSSHTTPSRIHSTAENFTLSRNKFRKSDIVYSDEHMLCVRLKEKTVRLDTLAWLYNTSPNKHIDSGSHRHLRYLGEKRCYQLNGSEITPFYRDVSGIRAIYTFTSRHQVCVRRGWVCGD